MQKLLGPFPASIFKRGKFFQDLKSFTTADEGQTQGTVNVQKFQTFVACQIIINNNNNNSLYFQRVTHLVKKKANLP